MRVLAIDLGDKRTGLAVGDRISGIASPAGCIEVPISDGDGRRLLDAIVRAVDEQLGAAPAEILLGLAVNMDGSEGPRAKAIRVFGQRLATAMGRDVVLVDERRTSVAADERMARTGLTHKQKKARRDAIAAAAIIQGYLNDPDAALGTIESARSEPEIGNA